MDEWSDDDHEERARVYHRIAPVIMEFSRLRAGEQFHVEELRVFVLERVPGIAPDSPGQILRALREEGRLDYVVINRRQSLYQFRTVAPSPPPAPVIVDDRVKDLPLFARAYDEQERTQ